MNFIIFFIVIAVILFAVVHLWTYSSTTDAMGCMPGKEYMAFLKGKQKGGGPQRVMDIPAPSDGIRDAEVEALLRSGELRKAGLLIAQRMEEARLAPVGRDKKIARANHYMAVLRSRGG